MTAHGSHKSYRPLTVLTYKLENFLFGLDPVWFHATNVVLHGVVCGLFTILLGRIFGTVPLALVGGLLFSAHPIHTEAVGFSLTHNPSPSPILSLPNYVGELCS